jgi:hypothetical protein
MGRIATQERMASMDTHSARNTTIKRRGILAAAGAVVAGIVAKQAAQPVAAGNGSFLVLGNTNTATLGTVLTVTGDTSSGLIVDSTDGSGIAAIGGGSGGFTAGVRGSGTTWGVTGTGPTGVYGGGVATGVYGTASGVFSAGVQGTSTGSDGTGVSGTGRFGVGGGGTSVGVLGTATASGATGVEGDGMDAGPGVVGTSGSGPGVSGASTSGVGVSGFSMSGIGVYGTSSNNYGVLGMSTKVGYAGLTGITTTPAVPAFAGGSSTPSANAAQFAGGVYVNCTTVAGGQFVVNPMSAKFGTVQHADGSLRLMASMEAPESWAVDIGAGKITSGTGQVTLDSDFAAVIVGNTYHVVLTPGGESNGLYVTNKTGQGFAVHEQHSGTSTVEFTWVVYAHPRNQKSERLKKFEAPAPLKLDIPKVPGPPKPSEPLKLPEPPKLPKP